MSSREKQKRMAGRMARERLARERRRRRTIWISAGAAVLLLVVSLGGYRTDPEGRGTGSLARRHLGARGRSRDRAGRGDRGRLKQSPTIYPRPGSYPGEEPVLDWAVAQDPFGNEFCLVRLLSQAERAAVADSGPPGRWRRSALAHRCQPRPLGYLKAPTAGRTDTPSTLGYLADWANGRRLVRAPPWSSRSGP